MSIELVFADPHPVVLDGLTSIFQGHPDFSVRSSVHDGEAALMAVKRLNPDILLLELALSKKDGLSLIREIQSDGLKTVPVVFTSAPIAEVMHALRLGIRGLVAKDKPKQVLMQCVRSVHQGEQWLDKDLTLGSITHLLENRHHKAPVDQLLTAREMTVARLVIEGWPNKKIASKLAISEGTAKLHLHHIYQKLNCPGRMALVIYMRENGLT